MVPMQAFLFGILGPILRSTPEAAAIYEPEGRPLRAGETIFSARARRPARAPGRRGPRLPLRRRRGPRGERVGARARRPAHRREDLASYEVVERDPVRVSYHGREVLTNPPPSSGGILIADALGILERLEGPVDTATIAEVIASTNRARDEEFHEGLRKDGYLERFLEKDALDNVATEVRGRLGSTTHISRDGRRRRLRVGHLLERLVLRAWWCPAPACTSTTCSARRT